METETLNKNLTVITKRGNYFWIVEIEKSKNGVWGTVYDVDGFKTAKQAKKKATEWGYKYITEAAFNKLNK